MTTNQTIDGVPRELSEAVSTIIRDICEHEPDDNPDSAHISIKALELILLQNLEGLIKQPAPRASGRSHGIPGTSFQRLNQLANEGE